jgi:hypothetical protein
VTTSHDNGGPGELPSVVVVGVTVVLVAVVASVSWLTYVGKPVQNLIVVLGTIVVPAVTALLAVRNSRQITKSREDLRDVQQKVDGKIDNLITDKSNLETQVASAGIVPVTSKVSWDPESTNPLMPKITPEQTREGYPPTQDMRIPARDLLKREGYDSG